MTRLSVNINKIATLRNARGGNNPDVVKAAVDCERFGAQGITVHPRPDERHIRYNDVRELKKVVTTELNVEGYPSDKFLDLVTEVRPHQVTLVPDPPDTITSNTGWDTKNKKDFLQEVTGRLKSLGVRTSIFINPVPELMMHAKETGTDRVELYTEPYASKYYRNKEEAVKPYIEAAEEAKKQQLEINAGHDLDLNNLAFLVKKIPYLTEVSIGHALICDALYLGLENTIHLYLKELKI